MPDYETSPFANPLPGAEPPQPANPFGAPASWAAPAAWDAPAAPPPQSAGSNALYELRPLSLGEILDRTFTIYRRRFWLYAGLSAIAATVPTLSTLAQFIFVQPLPKGRPEQAGRTLAAMALIGVATGLIALVAYSFTQAATVAAVSATYIGDETSIGAALKVARRHWFRYILITLWLGWSAIWLPLVLYLPAIAVIFVPGLRFLAFPLILLFLASLVFAVIAYIRNSLGVVASTVEDLKVRASMRRSKLLVAGHKLRVFAILLLATVLQIVASVVQGICEALIGVSHGPIKVGLEALALVLTFVSTAMVVPVAAIALCLFYIDERVRKEGFDVEILMLRGGVPPPLPPTPEALPSPFTSELV